jgi:hypothetical protein
VVKQKALVETLESVQESSSRVKVYQAELSCAELKYSSTSVVLLS